MPMAMGAAMSRAIHGMAVHSVANQPRIAPLYRRVSMGVWFSVVDVEFMLVLQHNFLLQRPKEAHLPQFLLALWTPSRKLLQGSEPLIELPPDAKEGAPHGPVAGPTGRVPTIHVENVGAPRGIVRTLIGKLHNKGTDLKELAIL